MIRALIYTLFSLTLFISVTGETAAQDKNEEPDLRVVADSLNSLLSATRSPEGPDPEVGIKFIKYVTEIGISSQFGRASQMYLWGMSGENVDDHKEILVDELDRLEPILTQKQYNDLKKKVSRGQPDLYSDIRSFWKSLDPTPATPYNERLVEHWKRIAYAKKYFNKSADTIFEADERAYTYVKYGQPDNIRRGVLQVSVGELSAAARQLAATNNGRNRAEFMAQQAYSYHVDNPYEVWIYNELKDEYSNNVVRMFAEIPETGFGEVVVLEDLIPDRAFAMSKRNEISSLNSPGETLYYSPGMLLQWIYYNKFSTVDAYYADLFSDIDYEYTRIATPTAYGQRNKSSGMQLRSANEHQTLILYNEAPDEISTDEKLLNKIGAEIYEYRFLDADGKPYSKLIVESDPKRIFFEDLSLNQDLMFDDRRPVSQDSTADNEVMGWYQFLHQLSVLDQNNNELSRLDNEPALVVDDSRYEEKTTSVFDIYPPEKDQDLVLTTVLRNKHPASKPKEVTSFDPSVRSYSTISYDLKNALDDNGRDLVISDLVLGFRDDSSAVGGLAFPFVVSNDKEIFQGDNLFVHFESYNLEQNSEGLYDLNVRYEILGKTKGLFAEAGIDPLQLSLDFPSDTDQIREDLEIESNRLVPGEYEMIITFTDAVSGDSIEKKIPFTVLFNEKAEK